ncbi:MAG: transglycosylase domain-containing protein, partial [Acidimicrobiia bacterium]
MPQTPPRRPRQPASSRRKPPARKAPARKAPPRRPAQRRGASSARRRNPLWRIRRPLFALFLIAFLGASGFLYALARAPLPEARIDEQTTFFFDAKGRRLASIDAGVNRVSVDLDQVPDVVREAVLAAEDRNFYVHSGVDPVGVLRALWNDIRGQGPLQGGSTITQQYVKNSYLTSERTLTRKVKEAIISLKVERKFDKDEILERYLNTIYFGRGAYGLQAASKAYFGKELPELELQHAAYLAGLIRAPELADAERDPELAEARRARTLRQMERAGFITSAERRAVDQIPITDYVIARAAQEPIVVGAGGADPIGTEYFVEHVRQELVRTYGEGRVYGGGLRVKTTIDLDMQRKAYGSVYGVLDRENDPAASLVAVDEGGQVKAMVGGRGYTVGDPRFAKVNFATGKAGGGSGRQAGSTFKPFLLSAMVEAGYTLESAFRAPAKVVFPKANAGVDYQVSNYENQAFDGTMNLIDATAQSVNTVYAQAANAIGPENIIESAKKMGVQSDLSKVGISVVL